MANGLGEVCPARHSDAVTDILGVSATGDNRLLRPTVPDNNGPPFPFSQLHAEGVPSRDETNNTFSAYRFHDDAPLFSQRSLRLTCRCGEELNGKKLHDPPDTEYITYTWIYRW